MIMIAHSHYVSVTSIYCKVFAINNKYKNILDLIFMKPAGAILDKLSTLMDATLFMPEIT